MEHNFKAELKDFKAELKDFFEHIIKNKKSSFLGEMEAYSMCDREEVEEIFRDVLIKFGLGQEDVIFEDVTSFNSFPNQVQLYFRYSDDVLEGNTLLGLLYC